MAIFTARKKPVEVQIAGPWDGTDAAFDEMTMFTTNLFRRSGDGWAQVYDSLHDTWVNVKPGQYVVRGVRGEFYPLDPAALVDTYDLVATADV